jgi:predicted dehydrogenase
MQVETLGNPIGVVVVGTGQIGQVHVECARRAGVEVLGLVGSSPERAESKARQWRVPRVYSDLESALADPDVDVIHVASPNNLHAAQAAQAVAAGKNVICEKPLTIDSLQAADLVDQARSAGVVNATCFNFRFYPLMHEATAMVARGDIGEPLFLTGSYHQDWLMRSTDWNWRLEPERAGRLRAVADIGSHWLDLVTWIAGRNVTEVMADLHTLVPTRLKPEGEIETFSGVAATNGMPVSMDTDDAATVALHLDHGTRGSFTVSQVSAGRKNDLRFEIAGSEGSLMWSSERSDTLWIGHRGRTNEVLLKDPVHLDRTAAEVAFYPGGHVEGYGEAFTSLFRAIYADVARGGPAARPAYPTFEDGYRGLLVADAILASGDTRSWVEVKPTRSA